jgi:hypothetical protein
MQEKNIKNKLKANNLSLFTKDYFNFMLFNTQFFYFHEHITLPHKRVWPFSLLKCHWLLIQKNGYFFVSLALAKFNTMKIKEESGSALITVLIFILIATLSITVMLQFNRRHYIQISNKGYEQQTWFNSKSIVHRLLSESPGFLDPVIQTGSNVSGSTTLFANDVTSYKAEPWGLLIKISVSSRIKSVVMERAFLVGKKEDDNTDKAIVLGNRQNPLIVTGSTDIEGDALVGPNGIRAGVLKGRRYQADNLIEGQIFNEIRDNFPVFRSFGDYSGFVQKIYQKPEMNHWYYFLNGGRERIDQPHIEKWKEEGIVSIVGPGELEASSDITFENLRLLNLIRINSKDSIAFGENSSSEQIVVKAKSISFYNTKEHMGQFIASRRIDAENSNFNYPSILAVINNSALSEPANLNIRGNSKVNGSVFLHSGKMRLTEIEKILIESDSEVNGLVYTNQYSEVYGKINGCIMTHNFYFYSSPTTYINWINGAVISRSAYNKNLCIPAGLNLDSGYQIIEEL